MFNSKGLNMNNLVNNATNRNNSPFFGASSKGSKNNQQPAAGNFADRASQMA